MNIDIEAQALVGLDNELVDNPYLETCFEKKDRNPIWDGHINVYINDVIPHSVKFYAGRVPVQIKGKTLHVKSFPDELPYSVETDKLRAYSKEGGTIFLVVGLIEKNGKVLRKAYFYEFYPLTLARMLRQIGKQKSKTVKFKKLPDGNVEIANLFLNFCKDSKAGNNFDPERLSFEEWNNNLENLDGFTFSYSSVNLPEGQINPYIAFTTHQITLYAKIKGINVKVPVDHFSGGIISAKNVHIIGINDEIKYTDCTSVWKEGSLAICFGKGCHIDFSPSTSKLNLTFSVQGTLSERIKLVSFVKQIQENRAFSLNGATVQIEDRWQEDLKRIVSNYETLMNIQTKLIEIHVEKDLDLDRLNENEYWKIDLLLSINCESHFKPDITGHPLQHFHIGNLDLLILLEEENGHLKAVDFFSKLYRFQADDSDGVNRQVSQFFVLKEDDLIADNFNADYVFNDLIRYEEWIGKSGNINFIGLYALSAYDNRKGNVPELLKLTKKIFSWLENTYADDCFILNYIQTEARNSELSSHYIRELERIRNQHKDNWQMQCGVNILLKDYKVALEILSYQEEDEQSLFKSFPIFNLIH